MTLRTNIDNPFGSFYDGYIYCSVNDIEAVLGKPNYDRYSSMSKTTIEWYVEANINDDKHNTIQFTIYNYKDGLNANKRRDKDIYWHIGTDTEEQTDTVIEILNQLGLKAYKRKLF